MIWLRRLIPLALGALSALGFAPWDCWPLTILSLAIWLSLVHEAPTLRRVLATSWLFGLGHFTIANLWVQQPFEYQDAIPPALGYGAVVLLAAYLAIYPMLAAGLAWRYASSAATGDPAPRPGLPFVLIAGAAWIVTEYLRGVMFTGYPWDPLSVIWVNSVYVMPVAAWVGTYAFSGLTVVVAGLLMLVPRRPSIGIPLLFICGLIAAVPNGVIKPGMPAKDEPLIRIVQPNLAEEVRPTGDYAENNFQALAKLSRVAPDGHPRLILWPEGAIRFPLEDGYPNYVYSMLGSATMARTRMAALIGDKDTILTGGQLLYFDKDEKISFATNSVVALGPDARLHGRYDKAHLVPYGEYLPMRPLLENIGLARLVPGDIDFIPGPGPHTMTVPGFGKVGMLICYEVIFSGQTVDPTNRPNFIFNPSNDAWFGTLGPPAHLAQARLRAAEEGLPVIRSTPSGISAVIAPNGAIIDHIAMGEAGAIDAQIPRAYPPTLFAQLGNWLAGLVSALLLICAIAIRRLAR